MTVHAHCSERIRLLREALAWYSRYHLLDPLDRSVATDALEADDALAATPPPDLPLAEGSEWYSTGAELSVRDRFGLVVSLEKTPSGTLILRVNADDVEIPQSSDPYASDILALARREGLV